MQTLEDAAAFASECCAALGDFCYPPRIIWNTKVYRWAGTAKQSFGDLDDVGDIVLAKKVWEVATKTERQVIVAHEVCHLVCYRRFKYRGTGHGSRWAHLMSELGYPPDRGSYIDISSIVLQHPNRYPVHCACMTYAVGPAQFSRACHTSSLRCKRCKEACRPGHRATSLDLATQTLDNIQA